MYISCNVTSTSLNTLCKNYLRLPGAASTSRITKTQTKMEGSIMRFRFDKEADVALVNAIMLTEAHTAKNGAVREKFNGACHVFVVSRAFTSELGRGMPKPK